VSSLNVLDQGAGNFIVQGELTFASIDAKTVNSIGFLKSAKHITVDLSQVTNTDSAGLALMIEWLKFAGQHKTQLDFKNIPDQLLNLARLSGFDTARHLAADSAPADLI
jgi:phospholipid transport system transporter-binding protein